MNHENYENDTTKIYGKERADRLEAILAQALKMGKNQIEVSNQDEDAARVIELWDKLPEGEFKRVFAVVMVRLLEAGGGTIVIRVIVPGGRDAAPEAKIHEA